MAEQTAAGFIGQQQAREVLPKSYSLTIPGMRCCGRPHQGKENGWPRNVDEFMQALADRIHEVDQAGVGV